GGQYPPYDFVPKDIQSAGNTDFQKVPSGTIGRVYIPASAAATWEVYYPNGLKKEYNHVQNYAAPLKDAMQNIQSMGGDPLQGGATISTDGCTPGVAGQGITKAVNWAVMIAKNDGYGYDQTYDSNQTISGPARETGWIKWQSDPSCTHQCGSFDCSSFIAAALTEGGFFKTNPNFGTGTDANGAEAIALTGAGFKKIADSATTSRGLLPGDILLWNGHTEMYIGNDQAVAAHANEFGSPNGGQVGDQTGQEISVTSFEQSLVSDPWIGVYRASS
ncbi:MAG TPA: hypothetical protein VFK97_02455, partial [Candidatus Saccharimonadales bacterium]|nr:hypothetical protein [Candidatus Saccharimonadales bacterium]